MNIKLIVSIISAFVIGIGLTALVFVLMDSEDQVSVDQESTVHRILY